MVIIIITIMIIKSFIITRRRITTFSEMSVHV